MLEKTLENPWDSKEIKPGNPKGNQPWIFNGRTNAEALILWPPDAKSWHWKSLWCWEKLKAGGEGDNRGWDDLMASLTQWTWVWASSGSRWWAGKPVVLQSMGLQRVGHDWATELKWTGEKVSFTLYLMATTPFLENTDSKSLHQLHLQKSLCHSGKPAAYGWCDMMWTMGVMVICTLSKLFWYEVSSLNVTLSEILCQCIRWPSGREFAANAGDAGKQVWSLGLKDPLKEEMAIHSSILA